MTDTSFASTLQRERLLAGLSPHDLAERVGVSRPIIARWERETAGRCHRDVLPKIIDALGLAGKESTALVASWQAVGDGRKAIVTVDRDGGRTIEPVTVPKARVRLLTPPPELRDLIVLHDHLMATEREEVANRILGMADEINRTVERALGVRRVAPVVSEEKVA